MGCPDAVLEMREAGFYERKDGGLEEVLGEIARGFAIGSCVYNVVLLLLYFL